MAPTEADEAAFMNELMQGIEDDFWTAAPTPDPSPVKNTKQPLRSIQPPLTSSPRTPSRASKAKGPSKDPSAPGSTSYAANEHDISAFLQGSENWDLDADPFSSPVKPPTKVAESKKSAPPPSPSYNPDPCTRCAVESVSDDYVDNRWRKIVIARVEPGEEHVEVILCDDWYQTDVRPDDIINVIGTFTPTQPPQRRIRSITLTSQANFLILHPDLLLTATALSNAPQCRRKPLLAALVRTTSSAGSNSTSDTTPALVYGSMLHEVMQRCLLEGRWDEGFVGECVDEAVLAGLGELVKLGVGEDVARREVRERAVGLRGFKERYWADTPKENGELLNTRSGAYDAPSLLAINKVLDVEEEILSPTYGLKGKLDATVLGIIADPIPSPKNSTNAYSKPSFPTTQKIPRTQTHTPLPLELKTGRPTLGMEHRAQTMLYTLLLSERYGVDVQDGLLFYTQGVGGEVRRVPRGRNEIRGLVGVRNELVGFMWRRVRRGKKVGAGAGGSPSVSLGQGMDGDVDMEDIVSSSSLPGPSRQAIQGPQSQSKKQAIALEPEQGEAEEEEEEIEPFLPPPIDDPRACQRCYAIDTCLLFRKVYPNHSVPLAPFSSLSSPSSSALSPSSSTSPSPSSNYSPKTHRLLKLHRTLDPPLPDFLLDAYEAKTSHLTPARVDFFARWERLLALEERDLVRFRRELWVLGAREREGRGRCFGGMVLVCEGGGKEGEEEEEEKREWGKEGKIHRFTYTFARSKYWITSSPSSSSTSSPRNTPQSQTHTPRTQNPPQSLLNGHMSVSDPITVSVEPKLLALARGYILELTPERVVLGVDHSLDLGGIRERLGKEKDGRSNRNHPSNLSSGTQTAFDHGEGDVGMKTREGRGEEEGEEEEEEVIFRIDKDELFGGMARVRNNLAQMFYADGDRKRLELVVDLRKPVFSPPTPPFLGPTLNSHSTSKSNPKQHLNPSQLSAIRKILSAEDFALILGMPGTGKTTVIAETIRELVGRGKSVLLSSYTHSAVDTILMKLEGAGAGEGEGGKGMGKGKGKGKGGRDGRGGGFGILRLGNVDKVHPAVRKYTLAERRKPTTVEQYEKQLLDAPVVATTCLSIEHALFSRRKFDYCIVDEASQITLPTCLGPLRFADVFVLVGDHYQLPPLVKNPQARKGGLDISLFRRLSEAHPEAVVDLRYQYRMNEDIMFLSNRLIYDDRLMCGSEEVRRRALVLEERGFLGRLHAPGNGQKRGCGERCWLEQLADESCKAVFVDTDALDAHESRVGDLVQNTTEAELVRQLTETLLHCGVAESQIGIISLYRQQVKLLQHLLLERKGVEILTADKSQGRDKDCVVVSLVRSNEGGHIGDLVKDWRRMNVSFTRARSKLVIFGSRKTLQREPLLAQFFELMEGRGWILKLQPGAHVAHERVFGGVQSGYVAMAAAAATGRGSPTRKRSVSVSGCDEEAEEAEEVEIVASSPLETQTSQSSVKDTDSDVDEDVEFVDDLSGTLTVTFTTTSTSISPDSTLVEDSWMEEQTLVALEETPLPADSKSACDSEAKRKVLADEDENDDIEIVEVKISKPSAKASTTASASKPRTELPAASSPSSSSSGPHKPPGPGKENTLMGWLNVKEKTDKPKPKENGSTSKSKSSLQGNLKKTKGRSTTATDSRDRNGVGDADAAAKAQAKARPSKRAKSDGGKSAGGGAGVLKGRPILQDLVANEM